MSGPHIPPKPSAYYSASPGQSSNFRRSPSANAAVVPYDRNQQGWSDDNHGRPYLKHDAPVTGMIENLMDDLAYTMAGISSSETGPAALPAGACPPRVASHGHQSLTAYQSHQQDAYAMQACSHHQQQPSYQYDSRPPTRPSSSASGIISLYTEDASGPKASGSSSHDTANAYRFPPNANPSASHPPDHQQQSTRHVSRPLPTTPGQERAPQQRQPYPSASTSPDLYADDRAGGQSYFTAPPQQHYTASPQPASPAGNLHSANSSLSSQVYHTPGYSPLNARQATPTGHQFHRPLPSTSLQSWAHPVSPRADQTFLQRNESLGQGIQRSDSLSASFNRVPNQSSGYSPYSETPNRSPGKVAYTGAGYDHSPQSSFDTSYSDRRRTPYGTPLEPPRSNRHALPPVPPRPRSEQPEPDYIESGGIGQERFSELYVDPDSVRNSHEQYNGASYENGSAPAGVQISEPPRRASMEKLPLHDTYDQGEWAYAPKQYRNMSSVELLDFSLLSNLAILLKEAVPRGTQIKGSIDYPQSFTGKDVVSTLQSLVPPVLAVAASGTPGIDDPAQQRKIALLLAKSLKSQLFFHEVDWGENELRDGVDEVYTFLEDSLAGPSGAFNTQVDDWASGLGTSKDLDLSLQLTMSGGDESRGRRKKPLVVATAATDLDELPTGVFTPLTKCYSPLCNKPGNPTGSGCYSPSCPNSLTSSLNRATSSVSARGGASGQGVGGSQFGMDQTQKKAWAELVAPELLKSIPEAEVSRQNAILETIQKEEEFLADLELLETLFVRGLQKPSAEGDPPPLPIGPERDAFIAEVFANHGELAAHIRVLVERLHVRQREENPIVQTVGDIFLSSALEWGEVYTAYLVNYPLAISRVKREIAVNPRFKVFVEQCRRNPAAHRHPLENFLFRPPARLQRYHLHLESILKKTEDTNADRESLVHAIEIINDQCKTAQAGVEVAELKVKIREYAYNLASKRNKGLIDMDLLNPDRQLVHQGRVLRKPDAFDFDWTELLAILFDNFFIVVKQKRREENDEATASAPKFVLAKRPIPVEMLEISGFSESSISRSIGLSNFHLNRERESRDFWPFTVSHVGAKLEPLTLFAPSKDARAEWKKKLEEAIGLRTAMQEANKVFEPLTLSDDVFALPNMLALEPDRPVPGADPSTFHGKVTCAVPFTTSDGRRLIAIGCADGVWIGLRSDPRSLRKVLHLKLVTQCAVLESFGIFVVLADKVLISYSLEALVPSAHSHTAALRPPQKLSGNRDVLFFNVGVLKDRTLLVYMKKKANESVFRALEPILNAPRANEGKSGSGFFGKFGKDSKNSDWFRIYKTFFIPSEAYSMQFLKSKLCIVCARGFEIMNLDSLLPGTIPDFAHANREDTRVLVLQKRIETAKPLGMFKTWESEFLLCYDAFACYVDRLGEPIRLESIIEWEGYPKDVAFSGRYVLAFDSRFIEVRDVQTGQLVQVIRGGDVRYVGGSGTVTSDGSIMDTDSNPVIMVKRMRAHGRVPFDFQSVLELVPIRRPVTNHPSFVRSNTILTSSSKSSGAQASGWI